MAPHFHVSEAGVRNVTERRFSLPIVTSKDGTNIAYDKAGLIQVVPMGREVRIPRTEVERLLVLYGRVSGHEQKDDLKLGCEDKVGEVAITYEDRLTRFGQAYLETLFACFGVTLTVLSPGESKTPEQELADDLLALIASFSGRLYGMRSHRQKELLQCAEAVLSSP